MGRDYYCIMQRSVCESNPKGLLTALRTRSTIGGAFASTYGQAWQETAGRGPEIH